MQFWRRYPGLLRAAALAVSAAAALLPSLWAPQAVVGVEDIVGDALWRLGASSQAEKRVVLVDIDERSLRQIGPWPWARSTLADLSTRLRVAGVQVQAYDINFPDPRSGDDALAAAWAANPTVVAQLFSIDPSIIARTGVVSGALAAPGCPAFAPPAFGYYGTAADLLTANPAAGHITPRVGADGVVRQVPALICHEGRAYASLALATLWRLAAPAGAEPDWVWHEPHLGTASPFPFGLAPAAWLTSRSLPGIAVPLDAHGNMRVPYGLTRDAFSAVSAAELLQRASTATSTSTPTPALLRGAIALVGATAFGMGDVVATPHSAVASGLEVHAQTLVGLLDNHLPYTPAAWPWMEAGLMTAAALLLLAVATRRRGVPAKRLPLAGLLLSLGVLAATAVLLLQFAIWLPWFGLVVFTVLASMLLATLEHALTRAQRERLSAHLGAYLPAPVAERLMASEPSGSLQLEPREVSVLVADIRNFKALATHGQPEEVAALLHAYCCEAVDVVERHGGVVENVVGDSIIAVWTAAEGDAGHARQALSAAQELVRTTRPLFVSRTAVDENSLVQPLALGIGVESGLAIVGSFGPARRRAHAALGEPVSVANRIQQMTADLSMPIVVGPQLAGLLGPQGLEPIGEYLLEGLAKHYQLFAPVDWSDLVSVDSNWATSAAGHSDKASEAAEWARWGDVPRAGRASSSPLRTLASFGRPSA
ncbi:MAG: adenylate/guanylate cyclase domain-containing protein [Pseudomonadota bacterium]|nr:adenylate/guanylate cyclase domain-containing protein [Pseudomonadota bacterium]